TGPTEINATCASPAPASGGAVPHVAPTTVQSMSFFCHWQLPPRHDPGEYMTSQRESLHTLGAWRHGTAASKTHGDGGGSGPKGCESPASSSASGAVVSPDASGPETVASLTEAVVDPSPAPDETASWHPMRTTREAHTPTAFIA